MYRYQTWADEGGGMTWTAVVVLVTASIDGNVDALVDVEIELTKVGNSLNVETRHNNFTLLREI